MDKQTAMQEMIEWLRIQTWGFEEPDVRGEIPPWNILNKATELLEKERQQIKDAYWSGLNGFIGAFDESGKRTSDNNGAEEYYNQTYQS